MDTHEILDGGSQNPSSIIITIKCISQLKIYVCHVHGSMQYACMDVILDMCTLGTYVCHDSICMSCVHIFKMHADVFNEHVYE